MGRECGSFEPVLIRASAQAGRLRAIPPEPMRVSSLFAILRSLSGPNLCGGLANKLPATMVCNPDCADCQRAVAFPASTDAVVAWYCWGAGPKLRGFSAATVYQTKRQPTIKLSRCRSANHRNIQREGTTAPSSALLRHVPVR